MIPRTFFSSFKRIEDECHILELGAQQIITSNRWLRMFQAEAAEP